MGLAVLCTVHISSIRAQKRTNEKPPPVPRPRIAITNHYYLEGIGFEPQNRAQPAPTCVHRSCRWPETRPPRLNTRILRPNREFVFSAGSLLPYRLTHSHVFAVSCPLCATAISEQKCTNPKPLPLAAPRITKAKESHSSRIGFFRKYRATPVRDGWQVTSNLGLICVHPCGPRLFSFTSIQLAQAVFGPNFSFPGVTALWRSRLSIRKKRTPHLLTAPAHLSGGQTALK